MFKIARGIPVLFKSSFFSRRFVSVYTVHRYSCIDTATAKKKSHFILSDRSDFHIIDNLPIAAHAFARRILTTLSVDETLLPKYVNLSTNFTKPPFGVESALNNYCFKWIILRTTALSKVLSMSFQKSGSWIWHLTAADGEAPIPVHWGVQSTPSLPLFTGQLWSGVVVLVRVLFMGIKYICLKDICLW